MPDPALGVVLFRTTLQIAYYVETGDLTWRVLCNCDRGNSAGFHKLGDAIEALDAHIGAHINTAVRRGRHAREGNEDVPHPTQALDLRGRRGRPGLGPVPDIGDS